MKMILVVMMFAAFGCATSQLAVRQASRQYTVQTRDASETETRWVCEDTGARLTCWNKCVAPNGSILCIPGEE